jgi:hypothetical protein
MRIISVEIQCPPLRTLKESQCLHAVVVDAMYGMFRGSEDLKIISLAEAKLRIRAKYEA